MAGYDIALALGETEVLGRLPLLTMIESLILTCDPCLRSGIDDRAVPVCSLFWKHAPFSRFRVGDTMLRLKGGRAGAGWDAPHSWDCEHRRRMVTLQMGVLVQQTGRDAIQKQRHGRQISNEDQ